MCTAVGLFQVMKWLVVPIIWLVLINITILINGETWVLPLICRILLAIYIALTEFNKGAMQREIVLFLKGSLKT